MNRKTGSPSPTTVVTGPFLVFPQVSRPVFIASATVIFTFVAFAVLFTPAAERLFAALQGWISSVFGW
ncbi:MAG: hypothetical protein R6T93_12915, partial [Trueperaceae bacterium]